MCNVQRFSPVILPEQEVRWKERYLGQIKGYVVYPEGQRWGRLDCIWNEKIADGRVLTHHYIPCVDAKEWALYDDDLPQIIFAKCLLQCLARPFHSLFKTIYHISMVPIFVEIAHAYRGLATMRECLVNSLKSLIDIVRTPLYCTVLVITSVVALVLGAAAPQTLYPARSMLGKIEKTLNWGRAHTAWTLTSCFQPFPMAILGSYDHKKCSADSIYMSRDPLEIQFADYARRRIRVIRKKSSGFFSQEPDPVLKKVYVSTIYNSIKAG